MLAGEEKRFSACFMVKNNMPAEEISTCPPCKTCLKFENENEYQEYWGKQMH
jgi:hypothetical protein